MMDRFDRLPAWLKKWLKIFFMVCLMLALLDLVVQKQGDHGWIFFGFYSIFGFIACVVLVLAASGMRKILKRNEDYYD